MLYYLSTASMMNCDDVCIKHSHFPNVTGKNYILIIYMSSFTSHLQSRLLVQAALPKTDIAWICAGVCMQLNVITGKFLGRFCWLSSNNK